MVLLINKVVCQAMYAFPQKGNTRAILLLCSIVRSVASLKGYRYVCSDAVISADVLSLSFPPVAEMTVLGREKAML